MQFSTRDLVGWLLDRGLQYLYLLVGADGALSGMDCAGWTWNVLLRRAGSGRSGGRAHWLVAQHLLGPFLLLFTVQTTF
jgi:hypothetical protein